MDRRTAMLALVVLLGVFLPAQADRLILTDGRTLSGKVTVDRDGEERVYTIVTLDGEKLTFPKAKVERFIYESAVSDWELLQMFEEWRELVSSALKEEEPSQREFLFQWQDYARNIRSDLWETPPSTDKFVDEWARYTAKFEAVAQSLKYKKLMNPRRGSNSLREYALYPPEGRAEVAEGVRAAIKSFENCLRSARRTNNLVRNLPRQQVRHANAVRRLEAAAAKARSRQSTAKDAAQRHAEDREHAARAARKEADVYQRIVTMANDIQRKTQIADQKVNLFAQERMVAAQQTEVAAERIERLGAREGRSARASRSDPGPALLPSGSITREFRRLIDQHRTKATGLTTVGLKALRERTVSDIADLYVGKEFTLQVDVMNITEAGPEGYVLTAEHSADWGERIVRTVELYFGDDVKSTLVKCKKGATVELTSRIKGARLLPDLPTLEASKETAAVHLRGAIIKVKNGCK